MRCNKGKLTLTGCKCSKISLITSKFLGNFRACGNGVGNGHFLISLDLAIPLLSFSTGVSLDFSLALGVSFPISVPLLKMVIDFLKLVCVDNLCSLIIWIRLSLRRKLPSFSPTQCICESSNLALGLSHLFIYSCEHGLKSLILFTLLLYESVKHILQRWSR